MLVLCKEKNREPLGVHAGFFSFHGISSKLCAPLLFYIYIHQFVKLADQILSWLALRCRP
jgi:hypothetical protein